VEQGAVAAALRRHLSDDGWVRVLGGEAVLRAERDDDAVLRVVIVQRARGMGRRRVIDAAVGELLRGMEDPEVRQALAVRQAALANLLEIPDRVWVQLGVRIYAVDRRGRVTRVVTTAVARKRRARGGPRRPPV
jgi:hypothetical protein